MDLGTNFWNLRWHDPADCFKYLYAELPPELVEQREEFTAALAREGVGRGSSEQAPPVSRPERAPMEGKSNSPDLPDLGIGESRGREVAWRS